MAEPRCSVVIPVHNKAALTKQCLDAILADPPEVPFELVVVDDASTDSTPELLEGYGEAVRSVRLERNAGFATACNTGAAASEAEYVLFLNNDTIPKTGWLNALVSYADAHPEVAAVGSKLLYPDETIQHAGVVFSVLADPLHIYAGSPADHPAVNKSRAFQVVTGACMLIRHDVFDAAKGFDTAYHNDLEDVDLCLRLGQLGHQIHYCHESVLYHLESVSRGRRASWPSGKVYRSRWGRRVRHDELDYYLEDGLLDVLRAPDSFKGRDLSREVELFRVRLWQVSLMLRERIRLTIEAAMKPNGRAGSQLRRGGRAEQTASPFPRRRPLSREWRLRSPLKVHYQPIRELQRWLASGYTHLHPDHADGARHEADVSQPSEPAWYAELRGRVLAEVRRVVRAGSTVLVVSKGDEELIQLDGCTGNHFPRDEKGRYAGNYPANSASAVAHLEELRSRGARYLVFPNTALWWLDHYGEFREHLEDSYTVAASSEDCLIFELDRSTAPRHSRDTGARPAASLGSSRDHGYTDANGDGSEESEDSLGMQEETAAAGETARLTAPEYGKLLARLRELVRLTVPSGSTVLVVSRGDDELLRLDGRIGWHFPQAEDGRYLGYHPADSAAAIAHLEELRHRGAQFLLFPASAFWWLEHYEEFGRHLRTLYAVAANERESGLIFELVQSPFSKIVESLLPRHARIAVLGEGSRPLPGVVVEDAAQLSRAADDGEALDGLEELERQGVQFLVIPNSAFGWLDRHKRFARDLKSRHRLVTRHQNACEIYELVHAPSGAEQAQQREHSKRADSQRSGAWTRIVRLLSSMKKDTDV